MASALYSQEFGFGLDLSVEQLAKVNRRRQIKNMETKRLQFTYQGVLTEKILSRHNLFIILSMEKAGRDIGAKTIWCCSLQTVPTFSRFSINNLRLSVSWINPAGTIRKEPFLKS
jgi:hypothetical protein